MMAKGPDWNDLHRMNPGSIRDAMAELDIPFDEPPSNERNRRKGNGQNGNAKIPIARCIRGGDFIEAYKPICYTIEGILPSGFLYGLTARRSGGKTAFLITASLAVIKGEQAILGREVKRGRVAYIIKENPDDFRMKLAVNCYFHGVDRKIANEWLVILDGRKDTPEAICEALSADAKSNGPFRLVCYDTFQGGFAAASPASGGDSFNSNAAVLKFVLRLRPITETLGKPSGLVAFHPPKNAGEDELFPYGGGAIMNEIDGNLTIWTETAYQLKFHWNRVRGPEFEPNYFCIEKISSPDIIDDKGREILLPVLRPSSLQTVEARKAGDADCDLLLLRAMLANPGGSQNDWAIAIQRDKSRVNSRLHELKKRGLVEEWFEDKWKPTSKGKKMASSEDNLCDISIS